MVGLLQGVAFSRNILVFCDSLDLAQGEPAMVAVVANQCSRLMAHCSNPLHPELPELGIMKLVDSTLEPHKPDTILGDKIRMLARCLGQFAFNKSATPQRSSELTNTS